jgi:uncharacterized protein DUF3237
LARRHWVSDVWSASWAARSKGRGCVARCCPEPIGRKHAVLDIDARYALKEQGGGLVRVVSQGYRHAASEVLAALARGEEVDPTTYFFRTIMRFETGAQYLEWLNRTIAVATAERKARRVLLNAHRLL